MFYIWVNAGQLTLNKIMKLFRVNLAKLICFFFPENIKEAIIEDDPFVFCRMSFIILDTQFVILSLQTAELRIFKSNFFVL